MFPSYHLLENCDKLRRCIKTLKDNSGISETILAQHNRYHYSIEQKLKSAMYQIGSMKRTLDNMPQNQNLSESIFRINMDLDSFLFFGGSALDILAREVLCYFGIPLPQKVYFSTAHDKLMTHRANDPLIAKLKEPAWKAEFTEYRNVTTHERLVCLSMSLETSFVGPETVTEVAVPLPDDPRADLASRTYSKNPSVLSYCERSFRRILRTINQIYGQIAQRATNFNLPL